MTSAALALDEELVDAGPATAGEQAASFGAVRTRLALALIVVVQVAWLAALGYAALAFA